MCSSDLGFGWVRPPSDQRLEAYWKGVLIVPERDLFIGRLEDRKSVGEGKRVDLGGRGLIKKKKQQKK